MSETVQTTLETFEKGDEITFNDRVQPLTVTRVSEWSSSTVAYVEGPRGGSYLLRATDADHREDVVERDTSTWDHETDWKEVETLESVELETPASEVEPPVEVGDEFKKQTTLDCVDYTGEWWGYRVTDVDRDEQEITVAIVATPPSADADDYVDELTLHYHELEDRRERWSEVDDLALDVDVVDVDPEIIATGCVGCGFGYDPDEHDGCPVCSADDADDSEDAEPEIVTDGGRDSAERERIGHVSELETGDVVEVERRSPLGGTTVELSGEVVEAPTHGNYFEVETDDGVERVGFVDDEHGIRSPSSGTVDRSGSVWRVVEDEREDRWSVSEPVESSEYVPLDMARNIDDERVRERIAWVDGLGRAYADALAVEDDSEVRPIVGPSDEPTSPRETCSTCGARYYGESAATACCSTRDDSDDGDDELIRAASVKSADDGILIADGGTSWGYADRHASEVDAHGELLADGSGRDRQTDVDRAESEHMDDSSDDVDESDGLGVTPAELRREKIEQRADELADVTALSEREALVWAYKEQTELTHAEIGEQLGIKKSAVDTLSRRGQQKNPIESALSRARRTLEVLDDADSAEN